MKVYKKMKRAVAISYSYINPWRYYDWYEEKDFPEDMKERVKNDAPFEWDDDYEYYEEEKYVLVGELAGDVLVRKSES